MKKSRFKDSQIAEALKRVEVSLAVGDVNRKHYNAVRPNSSLEYQMPLELVSLWKSESTSGVGVSG